MMPLSNPDLNPHPSRSLTPIQASDDMARRLKNKELKIDNAASSKTRCQYISTERSFLEFDCFNNHLKLVLVTYKFFVGQNDMLSAISWTSKTLLTS